MHRIFGNFADVVELADTPDLGSGAQAYEFKSLHLHQRKNAHYFGALFLFGKSVTCLDAFFRF